MWLLAFQPQRQIKPNHILLCCRFKRKRVKKKKNRHTCKLLHVFFLPYTSPHPSLNPQTCFAISAKYGCRIDWDAAVTRRKCRSWKKNIPGRETSARTIAAVWDGAQFSFRRPPPPPSSGPRCPRHPRRRSPAARPTTRSRCCPAAAPAPPRPPQRRRLLLLRRLRPSRPRCHRARGTGAARWRSPAAAWRGERC